MTHGNRHTTLHRYLAGVTENTFSVELGMADTRVIDYVVDLLLRFVHSDSLFSVRNLSGRRLDEVADMVAEAECRTGKPRREVHRHIGDFTLFFSGVFPEALRTLRQAGRKDYFVDYCTQGKRAYYIASTIDNDDADQGDVLARLSSHFELCAYGLNQVRKQWDSTDDDPTGHLLIN